MPHLKQLADDGKKVFLHSIFASGLLLKPVSFFEKKAGFSDWRNSLPEELTAKAKAIATAQPDIGTRYRNILHQALQLPADKLILGFSRPEQVGLLLDVLKS